MKFNVSVTVRAEGKSASVDETIELTESSNPLPSAIVFARDQMEDLLVNLRGRSLSSVAVYISPREPFEI